MSDTTTVRGNDMVEIVTFYVKNTLLGVDIQTIQEIHPPQEATQVPHADEEVLGVMNLRGEVITVLDLAGILHIPTTQTNREGHTIVMDFEEEKIGLRIDRLGEVVRAAHKDIETTPANVTTIDPRYIAGVHKTETDLIVLLNAEEVCFGEKQTV